ncbi:MAG: Mannose-6-phosphate isomerase [Bathelium mastoideum]|nr:MAG: Mannose-6-phosphate isomerase [Bathelium mastoideum]
MLKKVPRQVQEEKPYAELWMGTHPSLPSKDVQTQRTLLDLVRDNKALLSTDVAEKYHDKLPFLFKVLSIRKALSIQAHPNKRLAEQLHSRDSKNYPDDNHKPEMTIAITPFTGLCGFRPLAEISHFLSNIPTLRSLVGEDSAKNFEQTVGGSDETANKKSLQQAFTALMETPPEKLEPAAKELVESARKEGEEFAGGGVEASDGKELSELIQTLDGQFPGDIGLFVCFFLNYVKLDVGEAMFLKADDIHAYLTGDIIECMASSDNVVRAGFTPKFKDVSTLTSMLTYSYAPISSQKMPPVDYPYVTLNAHAYSSASNSILYDPPIEEFSVVRTELKNKTEEKVSKATFDPIAGPSIIICTGGEGTVEVGPKKEEIKTGWVYFVGATAECVLEARGTESFVTFKAFCELEGKDGSKEKAP